MSRCQAGAWGMLGGAARTDLLRIEVWRKVRWQPRREPVGHVEQPAGLPFRGVRAVVDLH